MTIYFKLQNVFREAYSWLVSAGVSRALIESNKQIRSWIDDLFKHFSFSRKLSSRQESLMNINYVKQFFNVIINFALKNKIRAFQEWNIYYEFNCHSRRQIKNRRFLLPMQKYNFELKERIIETNISIRSIHIYTTWLSYMYVKLLYLVTDSRVM